jgi:hypothetical protein
MRVEMKANKTGNHINVNGLAVFRLRLITVAELCQLPLCVYPFRNVGFSLRGFT